MVYVVQQLGWVFNDEFFDIEADAPVRAFAHREAAEAFCHTQEQAARYAVMFRTANSPLGDSNNLKGTIETCSTGTDAEFADRTAQLGIPFPGYPDNPDLWDEQWWEDAWRTLYPDRSDALWELCDRVRFYEVVEVEVEGWEG